MLKKPEWLKVRLGGGPEYARLGALIREKHLHTVCEEALCPNMGRCWEKGRATLMILGDACSRSCGFCNVGGPPLERCDEDEPGRVAEAVKEMGLADIVLTSVTRDDLEDGGASMWVETIRCVREAVPGICVEVLIPDFGGSETALEKVMATGPSVLGHNMETVRSLYSTVRPQADYDRSVQVLERTHDHGLLSKTGVMVGVGELHEDVLELMQDVRRAGCDIFTVGQYLQPGKRNIPVQRYVAPDEFDLYEKKGLEMGFDVVVSGPLVRSSFYSETQDAFVRARRMNGESAEDATP